MTETDDQNTTIRTPTRNDLCEMKDASNSSLGSNLVAILAIPLFLRFAVGVNRRKRAQ